MYSKKLMPYLKEFVSFLIIISFLIIYIIYTKSIVFKWSIILVLFFILLGLWFLQYVFSFVPFAVLVIIDLILKKYDTMDAKFIEQYVFKSSSFLDKRTINRGEIKNVETLFYKVKVKTRHGVQIFTSTEHFELEPNKEYKFVYGRKSRALVDVKQIKIKD